jgi:hypothetical protein
VDLRRFIASLPRPTDSRVVVAADTADDADVVQLYNDLAILEIAGLFTPTAIRRGLAMDERVAGTVTS